MQYDSLFEVESQLRRLSNKQLLSFGITNLFRSLPFLIEHPELEKKYLTKDIDKIFANVVLAVDICLLLDRILSSKGKSKDALQHHKFQVGEILDELQKLLDESQSYSRKFRLNILCITYGLRAAYNLCSRLSDSGFLVPKKKDAVSSMIKKSLQCLVEVSNVYQLESDINRTFKLIKNNHKPREYPIAYDSNWPDFLEQIEARKVDSIFKFYYEIIQNKSISESDFKEIELRLETPIEIRSQGLTAMIGVLQEQRKGTIRLNEARIIVLGDKGVGKTSISRKLINPKARMPKASESTAGVDTTLWKLEKSGLNIRIWDFAGHTVTHAVHQFFLSERCLYILVYDGRTEERNRLEYWLNHLKNYGGNSHALVLVNTRDDHPISLPENSLKDKYPILGFHYFSIKDDEEDLFEFRKYIVRFISKNPSWQVKKIPVTYYNVKEELEYLFNKESNGFGREHISKEEFEKIAIKHQVEDIDRLLLNLNSLGISLWYNEMKNYDTLVLNPEWISHGVYNIINWVNKKEKHSINETEFQEVFEDVLDRYPLSSHKFLFELMKHYELAYEALANNELIIPHLLKEDRPSNLPIFAKESSLMLRYTSRQPLLPNSISRFIVRHNKEILKEGKSALVWRYGVILEKYKTKALVREGDRAITVAVNGPNKTKFISEIRETLNQIFDSYKVKNTELEYRIEKMIDGEHDDESVWLPEKKIINHTISETPYFEDNSGQFMDLKKTAIVYNINATNVILGGENNQLSNTSIEFNFKESNLEMQAGLNDLAKSLKRAGHDDDADELISAAEALEEVEESESKDQFIKKGVARRIKRIVDEIGNDKSTLNKVVRSVKNGVAIAQDIAKSYNELAQWVGLPIVPKTFLKSDRQIVNKNSE